MSDFSFSAPMILVGLLLIPLFMLFFVQREWVRSSQLRRIGDQELVQALLAQISPLRRVLKSLLWLLTIAALIIALAQPTWGVEAEIVRGQGVQIMFAIDVSRSMDATDIAPSRLQRLQFDLLELLPRLEGNDVGVVIFARDAFPYLPLTFDMDAAAIFVEGLATEMLTRQGTNIPAAIETAMASFTRGTDGQRVIILMTDGESHEGDAMLAAQQAFDADALLFTVGYGTENGAQIPLYDAGGNLTGYKTMADGVTLVQSRLDNTLLRELATLGGGTYLTGGAINTLSDVIATLEVGALREQIITRQHARFGWFVALALLALALEITLPETRGESVT